MKRNLKFRAWDENDGKMLFEEEFPIFYEVDNGFHSGKSADNGEWYELPIMQFTGDRDAKGNEIYEGDIIKFTTQHNCYDGRGVEKTERIGEIYWQEFRSCFAVKISENVNNDLYRYTKYGKNAIVIGNIHKTPSLLHTGAEG